MISPESERPDSEDPVMMLILCVAPPHHHQVEDKTWDFTQRQTEEEIQVKKRKKQLDKARLIQEKSQSNVSLLAKIFNAGKSQ